MQGITINIDPVMLRLGHFELRWYSVMIVLAIVVAVLVATRESRKRGISSDELISLLPWMLLGGIIGARLFHVIDRWEYYAGNPLQIFQVQQGGLAIWGALAGGAVATVVRARVRHLPLDRLADALVPALLIAQIIGRFGCIINGDAYGGVTSLPWGFIYTHPNALIPSNLVGVPTHPYPVYEILWNGLVLLAIIRLGKHLPRDGFAFLSYLALYSLGRFVLTFVREEKIWFWGLQEAQVIAAAILVISAAALIVLTFKTKTAALQKEA